MNSKKSQVIIFIVCLVFFAPFLLKPEILTTKDNDLGRTYIPLYNFTKESLTRDKQIPLWRPSQMMGETFIGNPLSSLFYPVNIIFLILPVHLAAVFYLSFHFILAGIATFFLARSFSLSLLASLTAGLFYALSTKMLVHLEAGHITMIAAFSYFPLAFLAVRKLITNQSKFTPIVQGAVALTFMYITYPTIFYYALIFLIVYWLYRRLPAKIPFLFLLLITAGLSAITLLPQLEFAPLSTRSQLALEDVSIPLWNFKRFLASLFFPYFNLSYLDHESFLYLGIAPSLLAALGILKLPRTSKIIVAVFGTLTLLFVAGSLTPVFKIAYDFLPLLKYSRVTTRLWFIVALIVALLAAYALDRINKRRFLYFALIIFLTESIFIGYQRFTKLQSLSFTNESLYQYLAHDRDLFRVYCTSYCFNPQLLSKYKIQILAGETPIADARFVKFLAAAGNYHYSHFAVIFPPYQVWQKKDPPFPDAVALGRANVKYIASTYQITHYDFRYLGKFGDILLYQNAQFQPRAHFENFDEAVTIKKYSPNSIVIEFKPTESHRSMIISENFYPGWVALSGRQKFNVDLEPPIFRKVNIPPNSQSLELKYQPETLQLGTTVTLSTIVFLLIYFMRIRQKKKYG